MASLGNDMNNSSANHKQYTIILAGKLGVGKTSIFKRIQTGLFLDYPPSSAGKAEGELENHIYTTTMNGIEYTVSSAVH